MPRWAQANADSAPTIKNKRTAFAANAEPIVSRNKRDTFLGPLKVSSRQRPLHPFILLNPEAREKLYANVLKPGNHHGGQ